MEPHIFIVAGDASGDVYGAQLINSLRERIPEIKISGLGGSEMKKTGMNFLYNLVKEFCVMGFLPVILGMPKVMRFLEITLDFFDKNPPDLVVLIDYPGFNLYLATHTYTRKIPTFFYVTPQIWAWAPWRIKKIKKYINKMLVIFPFEVDFYQRDNVPVEYVGHPLLDKISLFKPDENFKKNFEIGEKEKFLALLPGSRKIEIIKNLPVMLYAAEELINKNLAQNILIALSSSKYNELVNNIIKKEFNKSYLPNLKIVKGKTYQIIYHSHLAMVTSGTATLETAILGTPLLVLYRVPAAHKWVFDNTSFLKCKFISLPNIISNKEIVPEFVISEKKSKNFLEKTLLLWNETNERKICLENLEALKKIMEKPGASKNTANAIINFLKEKNIIEIK